MCWSSRKIRPRTHGRARPKDREPSRQPRVWTGVTAPNPPARADRASNPSVVDADRAWPLRAWTLIRATLAGFIADGALSRGAAIAYYTTTSLAPLLLIVVALAGLVFGREAAQNAIVGELTGLIGRDTAEVLQGIVRNAGDFGAGIWASLIGFGTLLLTASGAFGELQSALNLIWKAEPKGNLGALVRARLLSLGLVLTLGFLLIVSLVVSAALTSFGAYLRGLLPGAGVLLASLDWAVSLVLLWAMLSVIYKYLPDKPIAWRDVALGALVTALLFTIGKKLIGLYLGHSSIASSYGVAGGIIVVLVWIYYTAQIFLLGAEFTRTFAKREGSRSGTGDGPPPADDRKQN